MTALFLLNTTVNGLGFRDLSLGTQGDGVQSDQTNTANGPQDILIATWITPALAAVSLGANTITINIWGLESNMNANAGFKVNIYRTNGSGVNQSTIATSTMSSELTTSNAARNWTVTATSTSIQAGDRIKVEVRMTDVGGTMATGYTVTEYYDGASSGQSGDSYVSFTETINPNNQTVNETATAAITNKTVSAGTQVNVMDASSTAKYKGFSAVDQLNVAEPASLGDGRAVTVANYLAIEETLYGT